MSEMDKSVVYLGSMIKEIAEALEQVKDLPNKINRVNGMLYPDVVTFSDEGDAEVVKLIYDWEIEEWLVEINDGTKFR